MDLVGELIWRGAIERISASIGEIYGAARMSRIRSLVNDTFGAASAASRESLTRYIYESTRAADTYQRGPGDYRPRVGDLPDPRRVLQYASQQGDNFLAGATPGVSYSFRIQTRNTNLDTGAETIRENTIVIFSNSPLTRDEAERMAHDEVASKILFDWSTDPKNRMEFESSRFLATYLTFTEPR